MLSWRLGEAPARGFVFVEDEGPWTYAQIAAAAVDLEERLTDISAGDRVAIRFGNDERFVAATHAIWCRRAVVVPIHPAAPADEVARVVDRLDVRALVCGTGDAASVAVTVPTLTFDRFEAITDDVTTDRAGRYRPPIDVHGSEPAVILLTSGSTGEAKGVVLSHQNAWANLRGMVAAFRSDTRPTPMAPPDKPPNLVANPLTHTGGMIRLLHALYVGRSLALLRKFDGRVAKRLIDRHGVDNLTINPTMLRMLLDALEPGEDLGRIRYVSSGTAPLTDGLRTEFENRFGVPVLQAYGQTELFGAVCIESVKEVLAGNRRPGSVGKPLPGVELRLVAADGAHVQQGSEGEILVRSQAATTGYLGAADANPLDDDGWLRTGDLGVLDAEGYLYITGRLKNIIICGGFNVIPEEVEAALGATTLVRDAVVLSRPDERLGEIPVALVESAASAEQILTDVHDRLVAYKRPRAVHVVDELPRVPSGKVDRVAARALLDSIVGPGRSA
jgi:long-chain acyl-CoA synthetase